MQITTYRIEHPRLTACWVSEWSEWAGEHNADWWTEYSDEDEALSLADVIGGIVVEVSRPMNYGDVVRSQASFQEAAE
jgi:hypothetical protein